MAHGCLANGAFEKEHFVRQPQRVGVEEVNLHLPRANFVDQRVNIELHLFAIVVNVFEQRVKFIDCVNAVGLARSLSPAAAANRWAQQRVGVGIACDQIKLQLGRHHGLPAFGVKQVAHPAQHTARGKRHQLARWVKAVMNHLGGGVRCPRHDANGRQRGL